MSRGLSIGPATAVIITGLGIDPAAVLRRAAMPADLFARGTTITAERYFDLWAALEAEFARPDLAVHVASTLTVEAFDPPLFAGLCSANLQQAAERIAVYKRLIGPMELVVDDTPDRLRLEIRWIDTPPPPDTLIEAELLFWVAFARAGTRSTLHPRALSMPRPPTGSSAFAAFVGGARLLRSPAIAIEFHPIDARRPFLTSNAEMWRLIEPALRRSLHELDTSTTWAERVSAVLVTALAAGNDTVAHAAAELAVSSRSLQRHLAGEGTSYARVLSDTRRRIALHYLRHTALSNVEIALLIGYDEPTSFHRAFQGWTGETPGAARAVRAPAATSA